MSSKVTIFVDIDDCFCIGKDAQRAAVSLLRKMRIVRHGSGNLEWCRRLIIKIFDKASVDNLQLLLEEFQGAQVVISSTWREHFTREEIVHFFMMYECDIGDRLAEPWRTPISISSTTRLREIGSWKGDRGDAFVIIDDHCSGVSLKAKDVSFLSEAGRAHVEMIASRSVLCDPSLGFDKVAFERARDILNSQLKGR